MVGPGPLEPATTCTCAGRGARARGRLCRDASRYVLLRLWLRRRRDANMNLQGTAHRRFRTARTQLDRHGTGRPEHHAHLHGGRLRRERGRWSRLVGRVLLERRSRSSGKKRSDHGHLLHVRLLPGVVQQSDRRVVHCCAVASCTFPADLNVGGVDLSVNESQGPWLVAPSGLWQASGWVRDQWQLVFYGDSPSGVCSLSASINGQAVTLGARRGGGAEFEHVASVRRREREPDDPDRRLRAGARCRW